MKSRQDYTPWVLAAVWVFLLLMGVHDVAQASPDAGIMAVESTAPLVAPELSPEMARTGAKTMVSAYHGGKWGLFIGWGVLLLIGAAKRANLLAKVPSGKTKWVAGAFDALGVLGVGLVQGWEASAMFIDVMVASVTSVGSDQFVFAERRAKKGAPAREGVGETL